MDRNIFQPQHPEEMVQAVSKVVHEGFTDKEGFEYISR
jgi:3-hydroxy-5-phosphonooxypentane-2,4-dione thiolase